MADRETALAVEPALGDLVHPRAHFIVGISELARIPELADHWPVVGADRMRLARAVRESASAYSPYEQQDYDRGGADRHSHDRRAALFVRGETVPWIREPETLPPFHVLPSGPTGCEPPS